MFARRTKIYLQSEAVAETPLLLPSFSSKASPEIGKMMMLMSEFITGGILISAYDIHYARGFPKRVTFPEIVFLDSGGYEARVDHDFSEVYGTPHKPQPWTRRLCTKVLRNWPRRIPTVAVTFDSPKESLRLKEQIRRAKAMQDEFPELLVEIIIKPEKKGAPAPVESLLKHVKELRTFAVVGLAEKELGDSILARMEKIARLRQTMDDAGINIPIHIFGSLDTLITPLYFISGAEIFDGLTWLRFGYYQGHTVYTQPYIAAQPDGLQRGFKQAAHTMWVNNYYYLQHLRDQMINYVQTGNLGEFDHISKMLEEAWKQLKARASK